MTTEWIIIETLAVLVENLAGIYFLNSRFVSRRKSIKPQIFVWSVSCALGLFAVFTGISGWFYDIGRIIIALIYLCISKRGVFWHKALGVILTEAITLSTSLLGSGVALLLTNQGFAHTLTYQDTSRLIFIILVKSLQVVAFFILAKKQSNIQTIKRKSTLLFLIIILLVFSSLLLVYAEIHDSDVGFNRTLVLIAPGQLLVIILIIFLYEMFIREQRNALDLSTRLQRLELEGNYIREIDAVYADIRTWRHEYRNNLIALRTLIEHEENKKALGYIDCISADSGRDENTLQTGNLVLDAVVSSKLWFARSLNIDVSIQAVYPENNHIGDNDLCAIAGNLLDNAIEACSRMSAENQNRFITFSLLAKGKNLTLSISNSYEGVLKRDGERYISTKEERAHGIGIQYVDSIVAKYQGHILREHADGVFETHVILPLIPAD